MEAPLRKTRPRGYWQDSRNLIEVNLLHLVQFGSTVPLFIINFITCASTMQMCSPIFQGTLSQISFCTRSCFPSQLSVKSQDGNMQREREGEREDRENVGKFRVSAPSLPPRLSGELTPLRNLTDAIESHFRGHPYMMSALRGEGGLAQKKM